ncbi:MAG: TRAP transporter large permease [Bacillota bacterium]|jgi:tripartite ATP-independent transporter DctM subunit
MLALIIFILLLFIGVPIGLSLLVSSVGMMFTMDIPLQLLGPRMLNAVNSYPLIAIPLFIIAAQILNEIEMTDVIFDFTNKIVGHIKGGLAHVNVLASIIFAGMSGSAVADVSGLGRVEIKAMNNQGFDPKFAATITAASSTIGPIIPPSIPLVLYAVIAQASVGKLLIAGIIPGIILAGLLMVGVYLISARRNYPCSKFEGFGSLVASFWKSLPVLMAPIILIGGMLLGLFTPTEAAAVAVVYALLLGFITKRLNIAKAWAIFKRAACDSSAILFVIIGASLIGLLATRVHLADMLIAFLLSFTNNRFVVLALLNVLLLIAGCLLDATSCLVLLTPILVPLAVSFGIDPVHFGVIMVLNLMIGLVTPPMGLSMFIVCDIAKIPTKVFVKESFPFLLLLIAALLLITYVPQLVLWLPNLTIK